MKLLVPIAPDHASEPVITLAQQVADRLQADVHLLTVLPAGHERDTFQPLGFGSPATTQVSDMSGGLMPALFDRLITGPAGTMVESRPQAAVRLRSEADERLQRLAPRFAGLSVRSAVVSARAPGPAIAAYIGSQGIAVAVMGTHAPGSIRRAVLGSVAEEVVRDAGIPVILAGPRYVPQPAIEPGPLLVCLDGSPFAELILPLARFVHTLHLPVRIVSVHSPSPTDGAIPADVLDEGYVRQVAVELRHQGVDASWEVLHGPTPARAIAEFAEREPPSLVALATHARIGLERLRRGSIAMQLVHESRAPVLLLHPHGA